MTDSNQEKEFLQNELREKELLKKLDSLKDPHELELFGKTLTTSELQDFFHLLKKNKSLINGKLTSIIAGIPHEIFFEVIPTLTDEELNLLQHECKAVPLQHHLTILVSEKIKNQQQLEFLYTSIELIINHIDIKKLEIVDLTDLLKKIDDLSLITTREISILNKVLKLAWNTDRIDFIETFNHLKENLIKLKNQFIGDPKTENLSATGLYKMLNDKLSDVYEDLNIPLDVPAFEALAKLSVWCLEDYFEIGLLPEIQSKEELDLDHATHSEEEILKHKEKLTARAKKALEAKGLITLKDLKKEHIYSRAALKEFLQSKSK